MNNLKRLLESINWRRIVVIISVFAILTFLPIAIYLYLSRSIDSVANIVSDNFSNFDLIDTGSSSNYEIENGTVKIATFADETVFGTGADGDVVISSNTYLDSNTRIAGRSCADGGDSVSYNVLGFEEEVVGEGSNVVVLNKSPQAGCLAVGDEVLLINVHGYTTVYSNVGNYETFRVKNVVGSKVYLTQPKTKFYGNNPGDDTNIGISGYTQRVVLRRVPNYKNLTINSGASVIATALTSGGNVGGVVFFRVQENLVVNGNISASSRGYRGGNGAAPENMTNGYNGEGTNAYVVLAGIRNTGGGARGRWNGARGGGGGSYGTVGTKPVGANDPGLTYGSADLAKLYMGSGGGGGSTWGDSSGSGYGGAGGVGGGIVFVAGKTVGVSGSIVSNGGGGSAGATHGLGGGGGSGGSVKIVGESVSLGNSLVRVNGGAGTIGYGGYDSGAGGYGRIAVEYVSSVTGTTTPVYYSSQVEEDLGVIDEEEPEEEANFVLTEVRVKAIGGTIGLSYSLPEACMSGLRMYQLRATANCSGVYRGKEVLVPESKWYNSLFDYVLFNGEGSL